MRNLMNFDSWGLSPPEIHRRVIMHEDMSNKRIPQPDTPPVPPERPHHKITYWIMRNCSNHSAFISQLPQRPCPKRREVFFVASEEDNDFGKGGSVTSGG
jgi:hypothetical protein